MKMPLAPAVLVLLTALAGCNSTPSAAPSGGSGIESHGTHDALSPAERDAIWATIEANRQLLVAQGKLPEPGQSRGAAPLFTWPVGHVGNDPGYGAISNFVDHDSDYPDQLLDYEGGDRTYDTDSGYNHQGIDVYSWPFTWWLMAWNKVEIRSAAAGTIINRIDGNFDQSCDITTGQWNAVYVQHADGSIAWYGHLKSGTLTPKTIGQTVARGEYLGVMGSSGRSTGPHLHLEIYDSGNNLIDPYSGPFNSLNASSWWADQPDYRTPMINQLATHSAPPDFGTCPQVETTHFRNHFQVGDRAYFAAYYRDQLAGLETQYAIYRPDGSVFRSWTHSSAQDYSGSYWYWIYDLLDPSDVGTWRFTATFQGQTVTHEFAVGDLLLYGGFGDDA